MKYRVVSGEETSGLLSLEESRALLTETTLANGPRFAVIKDETGVEVPWFLQSKIGRFTVQSLDNRAFAGEAPFISEVHEEGVKHAIMRFDCQSQEDAVKAHRILLESFGKAAKR